MIEVVRENVVKALEDSYRYSNVEERYTLVPQEVVLRTIDLLKEQEAVPVTQREVMHMLVWCCGSCGVAITDGDKFCRMCGKPVKWNA